MLIPSSERQIAAHTTALPGQESSLWDSTLGLEISDFILKKPFSSHVLVSFARLSSWQPPEDPNEFHFAHPGSEHELPKKRNRLETPMFLQLGLQEGFSHTPCLCSRGRGHGTGGGGCAASLPTQLTQRARRKAHHLHSPWVTSGLGQFTVYISQQKQTTQIPRH